MSTTWTPSKYGVRQKETNWLNLINHSHDMFCGCETPMLHFLKAAKSRGGIFGLPEKQLDNIISCLSTTEAAVFPGNSTIELKTTEDQGEDILDAGDLEKLFEEDEPFTEDSDG